MKVTFRNVGGNSSLALKAEWEQERPSSHAPLPSPPLTRCQALGKVPKMHPKSRDVQCAPSAVKSTPAVPGLWQREGAACCQSLHPANPYICPQGRGRSPSVARLVIKILWLINESAKDSVCCESLLSAGSYSVLLSGSWSLKESIIWQSWSKCLDNSVNGKPRGKKTVTTKTRRQRDVRANPIW